METFFSGFSIENFRIFNEKQIIKFAPVTILTGTNNSGKSSMLKALMLLSGNAKANGLYELDFNLPDEKHNLGSYDNVLNDKEKGKIILNFVSKEPVEWHYYYKGFEEPLISYKRVSFDEESYHKIVKEETIYRKILFSIEFGRGENKEFGKIKVIKVYDENTKLICIFIPNKEKKQFKSSVNLENFISYRKIYHSTNSVQIQLKKIEEVISIVADFFDTDKIKEILKSFDAESVYVFIEELKARIISSLIFDRFKVNELKHLNIISEVKSEIQEYFSSKEDDIYNNYLQIVGKMEIGEFTNIEKLSAAYNLIDEILTKIYEKFISNLNFEYLESAKSNSQRIYLRQWQGSAINGLLEELRKSNFKNSKDNERMKFMEYWMGKNGFNLGEKLTFQWHLHGTEIKLKKNGKNSDLSDLGYGTNQILAILIKIVLCKSHTLMIEEPEANIHPSLQSKLADLFINAYRNFGINFILETHSEYLIRKLQYLTAKKEISPNDTSIHYFYMPSEIPPNEKQVTEIQIKEDGTLTKDFGPGFLDEAGRIAVDLFLLPGSAKN